MSNEVLTSWMVQFCNLVKAGTTQTEAMKAVGIALETFSEARMNNSAFKSALELTEAGIGCTEISVAELLRLREAQVTEPRVAAYFGMTVPELKTALDKDENLKRVYETGVSRGQARIQVAQYEAALAGDPSMLKHTGEHVLDQSTKVKHTIAIEDVRQLLYEKQAELQQIKVMKQMKLENANSSAIDGEFKEIEDENTIGE